MGESAMNAMRMLGMTEEDVEASRRELAAKKQDRSRSKEVCICGHGIGRHRDAGTKKLCRPGRQLCRCTNPQPVLKVSDTRYFASKTEGPGRAHALMRGMVMLDDGRGDEAEMEWLVEPYCMRPECGRSGLEWDVLPVAIGVGGKISDRDEAVNVFACRDCRVLFS